MNRSLPSAVFVAVVVAVAAVLLVGLITAAGSSMAEATSEASSTAGAGNDARYYRSAVAQTVPPVSGLNVSARATGLVTVVNLTGRTVVVLGYANEPYLRISAAGVDENINSLSAKLNTVQGQSTAPNLSGTSGPAQWRHLSDGSSVTWRDYRTHWSSRKRPPIVAADPRHPHPVFDWAMRLLVENQQVLVTGAVQWTGAPRFSHRQISMLIASAVALLLAALVLIGAFFRRQATLEPGSAH